MFFITGLPRSRTYWFSKYFSAVAGVQCYHELQAACLTRQAFYDALEAPGEVGNSDSGLVLTDFQQRWPDAPTVVIERPMDDVRQSLETAGFPVVPGILELLNWQLGAVEGLRIPYDEVSPRLREIHEYLTDAPWEVQVAGQMMDNNLQVPEIVVNIEAYRIWEAA